MKLIKVFLLATIVLLTISPIMFKSATASGEPIYAYVENLDLQPLSSTVFWTMEPSSMELYVLPGHSADIIVTITNDASSDTFWQQFGMGFGGYWGNYMDFYFQFPPLIAPGESWTGPLGTVYVYPTTPYGTVCTDTGCALYVSVFDGEPSWDYVLVTVIAAEPLSADIDVDPDKLNLKKEGRGWVTASIIPPEGYSVGDIVVDTVELAIEGQSFPMVWFDIKPPRKNIFTAKFRKGDVVNYLQTLFPGHGRGFIEFKITGKLADDTPFEGTNIIQLIF